MMSADSADMLCQALHNQFHDWHWLLMSLISAVPRQDSARPASDARALFEAGYICGACLLAVQLSLKSISTPGLCGSACFLAAASQ